MRTPMQIINTLAMLGVDAKCLCDTYMKFHKDLPIHNGIKADYGVCIGYGAFVSTSIMQEFSVFAYEALKVLSEQTNIVETLTYEFGAEYIAHLKRVRDSIHIYQKMGSYQKKAERIIDRVTREFKHNYNISLFYRIKNGKGAFLGTNLFYYHMTDEFDGDEWLSGSNAHDYAYFVSSIVSSFQDRAKQNVEQPVTLFSDGILEEIRIESFDFTVEALLDRCMMSKSACVRLLLMHSYVSFVNLLFEDILHVDSCIDSPLWLCFFAKLYSIRYDEVLDSFDNLLEHATEHDKEKIKQLLDFEGFDRKAALREYARKLRNLIHYDIKEYPLIRQNGEMLADIERIYLNTTGLSDIGEFEEYFHALRFDMKLMELRFRRFFSMDYDVSMISRELSKGGKPV